MKVCKSKASFSADLRSPGHTPVIKNIRQHHVEHHNQNSPSASNICQRPSPKANKTQLKNEDSHAATRSTPWDSHLRGLPVAIACRMSSTRKQGRKEIRQHVSLTFIMLCWFIRDFWHSVDFGLFLFFHAAHCNVCLWLLIFIFRQFFCV